MILPVLSYLEKTNKIDKINSSLRLGLRRKIANYLKLMILKTKNSLFLSRALCSLMLIVHMSQISVYLNINYQDNDIDKKDGT